MSNAVAFHPERVAGDPASLRWVFPDGAPPTAATALGSLVDEGVLTDLIVEPSSVVTTLADGLSWREPRAAHPDRNRVCRSEPATAG